MSIKNTFTMKSLPEEERPREKLIKYGVEKLSTIELLAVIIRTGTRNDTALDLSRKILSCNVDDIYSLLDISAEELQEIEGVGIGKASQILAAIELGKRVICSKVDMKKINSSIDIGGFLVNKMKELKKEHFDIVMLDSKNKILGIKNISKGSLNATIVHPREVFKEAIKKSSSSIILTHNHPSGDPSPSFEDIELTKRLLKSGEIVGIKVLDHIIVGDRKYLSFKEEGIIKD